MPCIYLLCSLCCSKHMNSFSSPVNTPYNLDTGIRTKWFMKKLPPGLPYLKCSRCPAWRVLTNKSTYALIEVDESVKIPA